MRALAEFIMRGRFQAALVALFGNLLPLISPAAVALVTLRRNLSEGFLVMLWAALPSFVAFYIGAMHPLIIGISVASLLAIVAGAEYLRRTLSWPQTLILVAAICGLGVAIVGSLLGEDTRALAAEVQTVVTSLSREDMEAPASIFHRLMAVTAQNLGVQQISSTFVLGFLAWLTEAQVVSSLLLARWWQAMLYNPGGFRQEFHGLRLDRNIAVVLVAGIVLCYLLSGEYAHWASLMGMPLLLAGLGLIHFAVAFLHKSGFWVASVYIGLLLLSPLSLVVVGIGFLDSILNLRPRLAASRGDSGHNDLK